jgi:hypothetical protein
LAALLASYPEHSKILTEAFVYGDVSMKDVNNQRKFFDKLAEKYGIQKPSDWTTVNKQLIMKEKGGHFINNYYNGSLLKGKLTY